MKATNPKNRFKNRENVYSTQRVWWRRLTSPSMEAFPCPRASERRQWLNMTFQNPKLKGPAHADESWGLTGLFRNQTRTPKPQSLITHLHSWMRRLLPINCATSSFPPSDLCSMSPACEATTLPSPTTGQHSTSDTSAEICFSPLSPQQIDR